MFRCSEDKEVMHVPCPFHNDSRPSMRVNLRTESYICFAYPEECGKGHLKNLVAKYYDITPIKAVMLAPPLQFTEDSEILPENFGMSKGGRKEKKEALLLPEVELEEHNKKIFPRFIMDRGFTKKNLRWWECGTQESTNGLFIPSRDEYGRIVGSIVRRPDGYNPKYMYSKHYPRNKSVFGLWKIMEMSEGTPFVIITEGSLDSMWLWQFGYPSVSLLGGTLSIPQKMLLTKMPTQEIVLCFDNDKVGKNVSNSVLKELSLFYFISRINLPPKYKDIQEVKSNIEINELIDNRLKILL